MATPHLSEDFLGMRGILNARASAWWQDVLGEPDTHVPAMWLAFCLSLVHHMEGGMEGERGGQKDGWLKGNGWTVPSPTPGAGQHLPGLVQTPPHPCLPHRSCPCDHYIMGGKEEAPGGDVTHSGPRSASQWSQCPEQGHLRSKGCRPSPCQESRQQTQEGARPRRVWGGGGAQQRWGPGGPSRGEL